MPRDEDRDRDAPETRRSADAPQQASQDDDIGRNLKRVYQDVVNEPVPDRFKNLLDQLRTGGEK